MFGWTTQSNKEGREGKQVGGKIRHSHPQAATNNTHHLWCINREQQHFSPEHRSAFIPALSINVFLLF